MPSDKNNAAPLQPWFNDGVLYNQQNYKQPDFSRYDRIEVGGCMEGEVDGEKFIERVEDTEDAQFWTVYGHMPCKGCEAITDCRDRKTAFEIAAYFDWLIKMADEKVGAGYISYAQRQCNEMLSDPCLAKSVSLSHDEHGRRVGEVTILMRVEGLWTKEGLSL